MCKCTDYFEKQQILEGEIFKKKPQYPSIMAFLLLQHHHLTVKTAGFSLSSAPLRNSIISIGVTLRVRVVGVSSTQRIGIPNARLALVIFEAELVKLIAILLLFVFILNRYQFKPYDGIQSAFGH